MSNATLPEELVALILSHLNAKKDASTVHALRLSNRMLCRLATPYLYRTIHVGLPTSGNYMKLDDATRDKATVKHLIDHPAWTGYVKELKLTQSHENMIKDGDEVRKQQQRQDPGEDLESSVMDALEAGFPDNARVAFVLLKCENVQVFESTMSPAMGRYVSRTIDDVTANHLQARLNPSQAVSKSLPLSKLSKLSIHGGHYEISLEKTRSFLCLPALLYLRISGLADNQQFFERKPPKHDDIVRNTNRLTLVLDSCMLSGVGLDTLLATCPNARSLTIRWRIGLWNEHFRNEEACDVLRKRGGKLEELVYDTDGLYAFRCRETAMNTFGSFADLNLKRFAIQKAFFDHLLVLPEAGRPAQLAAAALLPKGLKELHVLGVEDEDMSAIMALVGTHVQPGLKKSACVPFHHYSFYDHGGMRHHKSIDYNRVGGFELKTTE